MTMGAWKANAWMGWLKELQRDNWGLKIARVLHVCCVRCGAMCLAPVNSCPACCHRRAL